MVRLLRGVRPSSNIRATSRALEIANRNVAPAVLPLYSRRGRLCTVVLECISAFNLCRSSGDFCVKQSLAAVWRKGGPRCPSVKNNPRAQAISGLQRSKNVGSTAAAGLPAMYFYASAKGSTLGMSNV